MFTVDLQQLRDAPGYWYIATPYSKRPDRERAWREALQVRGFLLKHGITAYSPIAELHPVAIYCDIDPLDWDLWKEDLEPKLRAAFGLIVVKFEGCDDSDGVAHEIAQARRMGKPIYYLDPNLI